MSQRLFIGKLEEDEHNFYDYVISEAPSTPLERFSLIKKLCREWFAYSDGMYLGPMKVTIRDKRLHNDIIPFLKIVCKRFHTDYPEQVSTFYR